MGWSEDNRLHNPKKRFVLIREGKNTSIIIPTYGYKSDSARVRAAARKAAARGETDIRLREIGTKTIHIFKGERYRDSSPSNAPVWLPRTVWIPKVKKVGVEYMPKEYKCSICRKPGHTARDHDDWGGDF